MPAPVFRALWSCLLGLLLGALVHAADESAPVPAPDAETGTASAHLLQPGDVLEITVYEHPELALKIRVDPNGTIRFPLCGKVEAAGKTAGEISELLSESLTTANIARAQVFAFVTEYTPRFVYVLGEVAGSASKALEIPPEGRITALQAVSRTGGFSKQADLRNVFVLRTDAAGTRTRLRVDVRGVMDPRRDVTDIDLRPGDTVMVPTARPVSVFGMVNTPGAFDIDTGNPVSVAEILSRAGGFKEGADRERTLLLRADESAAMKTSCVDMGKVMQGGVQADTYVEPGDTIVAVPRDKVFVLGQVKAAGAFDSDPENPLTVTRSIAMAGGFDRLAAKDGVLLIREGKATRVDLRQALKEEGDVKADQILKPGDIVFVAEARW